MPPSPLTRPRLRALADARAESGRIVSLYLNLDATHFATPPARATAITSICNELEAKAGEEQLEHEQRRRLDEAVERIEAALHRGDIAEGGTQAVAMFANSEDGTLESFRLPHPVDSRVDIDTTAYVEPLVGAASEERWLVLLANRSKARFFVGPREALVETDRLEDDVHRQHSQGGWSQARYQRSVDEEVRDHLKNTADIAFQIFKRRPFDHVLVAAPEETVGDVEQALHPYLQQRLAGRLQIDVGASSEKDVQTAAAAAVAEYRRAQERQVLDRIAEHVGRGDRGAAGLAAVLDALNQARVEVLVVLDNLQAAGFRDPTTEMLAVEDGNSPGGGEMERIENIVEEAMQKAVETSAEVVVVREHREEIEQHGGIAALLRF